MEIKYAKARQQGLHNFNRHSTPIDYVTMRNLQEYPEPPREYQDKFARIAPQKFNQEDLERIFVYGEYLKRKFYLDCYYTSTKQKNNYKYTKNIFNSNEECINYIENIFILNEDKLNFGIKQIYGKDKFIFPLKNSDIIFIKQLNPIFIVALIK